MAFRLIRSQKVIGCYAQTELGHGSNIRALETTATFIRETDEFDIHTPSITATKWCSYNGSYRVWIDLVG